jgi:hypothetical protein
MEKSIKSETMFMESTNWQNTAKKNSETVIINDDEFNLNRRTSFEDYRKIS